jgi:hypothetical protein
MAGTNPSAGANLILGNASPIKQAAPGNYLDFTSSATAGWAHQYLPELYEAEVERYGDRTVSGFLQMVGAEMPMTSDQVVWSEQGRLHISYDSSEVSNPYKVADASANTLTIVDHAIKQGNTIVIKGKETGRTSIVKAYVSAVSGDTVTVKPYKAIDLTAFNDDDSISVFVYGSEFAKGSSAVKTAIEPQFQSLTNKPIILRDYYTISGSDASQIGWVEVTGEGGQSGYLWYIKAEGDTRTRFEDYMEMSLVEAQKAVSTDLDGVTEGVQTSAAYAADIHGTEGLFEAIESRGHVTTGITGAAAADDLESFDYILKKLDKEGAIEENMLFVNRDVALAIDDMLAAQNSYGDGGTSFGVFNNSADMALNLGFSGFRRGSYDFYKTDWKYLNDATTRGLVGGVRGALVPAGTSSVYDQILGKNIKRPFLHVRYRASEADNRRMKTWLTGSVGGASTSGDDIMEVHYLSERCLVVQGANNFMLLS